MQLIKMTLKRLISIPFRLFTIEKKQYYDGLLIDLNMLCK